MLSKNKYPKILVGCPINIVKDYCMDQWLGMLKNLSYPNYDIYLVDNTKNKQYHKDLRHSHNLKIDYVDPAGKQARYYMAESIEKIRQRAVKHNYEYLCIIECDIFPPASIIELLLLHDKEVVGTSYMTGHGNESFMQLLNVKMIDHEHFASTFYRWAEIFQFYDGKLKQAFANGNGCILISKNVFNQITFRVDETDAGHADSFFHKDLFTIGIPNYVDTSIIPLHLNSRWSTMPDDVTHAKMWNEILSNRDVNL